MKSEKGEKACVCVYDNGAYINSIVKLVCQRVGVKLVNTKLVDNSGKSNSQDKYQMAELIATHYSGKEGQVVVLGDGIFASDLLVKCNNEHCRCVVDSQLSETSRRKEDLRKKMNDDLIQKKMEREAKKKIGRVA